MAWLVLGLSSCTLGRLPVSPCADNATCRASFGWGWVCGEETGLCEEAEVPARCTQTWPENLLTNRADHADDIVLGVNYDLASFGYEVLAARLALIQANEQGGLDGRDFALIECTNEADDRYDALTQEEANEAVTRWLADDIGVPGIVGPATSGRTEAAYQIAAPLGTLLISPSATSPALTTLDGLTSTDAEPGLLWRTAPPDSLQGEVIAGYMTDTLGATSVAVIHEVGPYGEGLADAFAENFTGTITRRSFANSSERDEAVASTGDAQQVLFIGAEKDDLVAFFYAASQISGFNREKDPIGIFLADGAYYIDIFEEVSSVDDLFAQVRGSRPTSIRGGVYDAFAASYAAAFAGQDPGEAGYTAYAFDAGWLMLYGAAWSASQEGEITGIGMARGLRRVSSGEPLDLKPSSWLPARAQFQAGQGVDVTGASGDLDYDPVTGETSAPIEIWGVEDDGAGSYRFTSEALIEP